MRNAGTRVGNCLVLILVAALPAACEVPEEEIEAVDQPLVTKRYPVTVHLYNNGGSVRRWVDVVCGQRYVTIGGRRRALPADCTNDVQEVKLLAGPNDSEPFGATAQGPYHGCGPQASANLGGYLLDRWFDVADVKRWTNTWGWGSNIGTTPDRLMDSIRSTVNLDLHSYRLEKHHGAWLTDMRRYLLNGYPVILLVNGGNHYQMLTGYRAPDEYYVVDYAWANDGSGNKVPYYDPADPNLIRGQWKTAAALRFYVLDDLPSWAIGFQGYKSATAIGVNGADIPF